MNKPPYKMTLQINYTNYVMDEDVAIEVFKLLNRSVVERIQDKWDSESKTSTYYLETLKDAVNLKMMNASDYAVLKLATVAIQEQKT